jgi:hypothetical protein
MPVRTPSGSELSACPERATRQFTRRPGDPGPAKALPGRPGVLGRELFIGGKPGATVVALDKITGKEVWRALGEQITNSSPIIIQAGGKRQLIVWTHESVASLNPPARCTGSNAS